MTPEALRACLARLGLTQSGAARLLGVRVTTMQRWAGSAGAGGLRRPPSVLPALLIAMERRPALIEELRGGAYAPGPLEAADPLLDRLLWAIERDTGLAGALRERQEVAAA